MERLATVSEVLFKPSKRTLSEVTRVIFVDVGTVVMLQKY
jgi:hypothetical protein